MKIKDNKTGLTHEVPDLRGQSLIRLFNGRFEEVKEADIKPVEETKTEEAVSTPEEEEKPRRRGRRPKKES